MKKLTLILVSIFSILVSNAQTSSIDYFGQTPPGNTALKFASGILSLSNRLEARITFSPDGNECYFEVAGLTPSYNTKIYYTKRINNVWSEQLIAPFSVANNCASPYFSLDGKKLFFTKFNSDFSSSDVWVVKRTTEGWSEPQQLPTPINSVSYDGGYAETADSVIYIDSKRSGGYGGYDIWRINTSLNQVENLGSTVNTNLYDSDPCIAPDGSYLIFSSERFQSNGGNLLCISFKKGSNGWTTPVNMNSAGATINNSTAHHAGPSLSPDGKYLFFFRHSDETVMDVYWVSSSIITDLKKYVFAPKLSKQIPDITVKTDSLINYVIPANTFTCEYGVDSLKYTATLNNGSALPQWLTFNASTRTLSGTPQQTEINTIKITATNKDTVSSTCTFKISVSPKTGIEQLKIQNIKIFPNPTTGLFTLSFGSAPNRIAKIEILNTGGKLLLSENLQNKLTGTIDLTGYPKGVYLVKVVADGINYNTKIQIQ